MILRVQHYRREPYQHQNRIMKTLTSILIVAAVMVLLPSCETASSAARAYYTFPQDPDPKNVLEWIDDNEDLLEKLSTQE